MELLSQLVHAEPGHRVVLVAAWLQGACLGSALGEGSNAEAAEDRAIERLHRRLTPADPGPAEALAPPNPPPAPRPAALTNDSPTPPASAPPKPPVPAQVLATSATAPTPKPTPASPAPTPTAAPAAPEAEPPADPEDWSDELAEVELELKRLGWAREQEATYLGRAFGHPSRSRLVRYADLLAYRQALRQLAPGSDPAQAPPPLRRPELLGQCDQLLGQLHWGPGQGRDFLEKHFSLSSRQQLSDDQLLHFNMLLEGVLIGELPAG